MAGEFEVPQFYETTLTLRPQGEGEEPNREFVFMCAPVAAIHKHNLGLLDDPPGMLTVLGVSDYRELRVAQLPDGILTLLRADSQGDDPSSFLDRPSDAGWLAEARELDPDAALFAEYLAFAEVVPFEQSKLSVSALATLARKSYGIPEKAGTYVGLGAAAAVIMPHVAVAYLGVVAAGTLGLVVVDSIGVIAGAVTVPGTGTSKTLSNLRSRFKQLLIHRPPAAQSAGSASTAGTPPATTVEPLSDDELERQHVQQQHEHAKAMQARMKTHEHHIDIPRE